MRHTVLGLVILLVACEPASETSDVAENDEFLDPLVADGEHYKLEFENDYVRVLRENLSAGEGGAMHSHRARVSVILKDAEVELTPRGGEPVVVNHVAGTASWGEPVTHTGVTKTDVENLSIELQDLDGETLELSELDATRVDPEHHVVELENELVRVVRMSYPAGATSPVHDHPPGFTVFLTDVSLRNIPEEGEPREINYEAGDTLWGDGGSAHATENVGESDAVILRVELKKMPSRRNTSRGRGR